MIEVGIAGIGLWAPGLTGWETSLPILRGECDLETGTQDPHAVPSPPGCLPANERRRSSATVRLAVHVASEAVAMAGLPASDLRGVFSSANGDGIVVHGILEALAKGHDVSPTAFHNSVHNAPAGYWSIGQASRAATTSLGAHDGSFAAALLKAVAEVRMENHPVLLCVYDTPMPEPLNSARPLSASFAVAMVLTPPPMHAPLGHIAIAYQAEAAHAEPSHCALRVVARGNPAARSLRLLEAIAQRAENEFPLCFLEGSLALRYRP